MTAFTQLSNTVYNKPNRKDRPPRRKRPDIAAQFEAAGFALVAHNKFDYKTSGIVFEVRSSDAGLKVFCAISEPTVFNYGTDPEIIAGWCKDLAASFTGEVEDWLTADLPQTEDHPLADYAPYCYGLAGEV